MTTPRLLLVNGGRILSNADLAGSGGAIAISAGEIVVTGVGTDFFGDPIPSAIQAGATPFFGAGGDGGSVVIESDRLLISDSGTISVASEGEGAAGNISIATDVLRLENDGTLNASTRSPDSQQGNIALDVRDILLVQNSAIATESPDLAGSGNIELSLGSGALAIGTDKIQAIGGLLTINRGNNGSL